MIKRVTFLLIVLSSFSCEKFDPPPEYDKLIGTWENVTGDEDLRIKIFKRGKVKMYSELEKAENFRIETVDFYDNYFHFEIKNSSFSRGFDASENLDTISLRMGAFNQLDSSLNQLVYFIKAE